MFESQADALHFGVNGLVSDANKVVSGLQTDLTTAQTQISSLQSQLAKRVYDDLAYGPWWANFKAEVGGSGKGKITQDKNIFTLIPDVIPGGNNYFDCYFSKSVPPKASDSDFQLKNSWMLKTSADVKACRCLEMEMRHIFPSGLQFVKALQMDFADGQLRIFDHVKKWFPTGVPMARFIPGNWYTVILNAHHDDVNVFYDSIIINGATFPLGGTPSCPAFPSTWGEDMKIALQPDGKDIQFDSHYKDTVLTIG